VKTIPADELRWNLTQVAQAVVAGARVVCTHRGRPKFALVPLADFERLEGKPFTMPKPRTTKAGKARP